MKALRELLVGRNESIPLDVAALQVASIEFPGLEAGPTLDLLDALAADVRQQLPDGSGEAFVATMNRVLFQQRAFHGSEKDYYNPRNSCLNQVVRTGAGIPISLSVLYIEVARRLDRRVAGIGMPGHFVVHYSDRDFHTYVDPFHGGTLLTAEQCLALSETVTGINVRAIPQVLSPVGSRQIALRMLHNLRAIYFRSRSFQKGIQVMNLLIDAEPASAEEYKQRSMLHMQLKQYSRARQDLDTYLALAPEADDKEELEKRMREIQRYIANFN